MVFLLALGTGACQEGEVKAVSCRSSPCIAEGMAVTLVLPSTVPCLRPFPVKVEIEGAEAIDVTLTFVMEGMDMGLNRYRLEPSREGFHATAMLPVCTSGRRDWWAEVAVGGRVFRFPFRTGG